MYPRSSKKSTDQATDLPTPMVSTLSLSSKQGNPVSNAEEYRSFVGALQYILVTRLDIAFSVNKVSQFMHCSLDTHLKAAKRILRFLKGTLTYGMTLQRSPHLSLVGFSVADCGSDPDD